MKLVETVRGGSGSVRQDICLPGAEIFVTLPCCDPEPAGGEHEEQQTEGSQGQMGTQATQQFFIGQSDFMSSAHCTLHTAHCTGKNRVLSKALGSTEEEKYSEGLSMVAKCLRNECGLLVGSLLPAPCSLLPAPCSMIPAP